MTREESERYNIKAEDSDYSGSDIRRTLRKILSEAKEKIGFDIGQEKVLIQIYPTDDGGLELFATKLGTLGDRERRTVSASDNLTTFSGSRGIYCFSNLSELCLAAKAIYKEDVSCDVYYSDLGEYYISIMENLLNGFSEFEILCEYGRKLPSLPPSHLSEHTRLLCEGKGLEIFSRL
jgi:hypothetical protein